MIILIISLILLTALFGVAFTLTGALLKALLWVFICLPIGLFLWVLGVACCCTLLLIPVGIALFKAGTHVIVPGL